MSSELSHSDATHEDNLLVEAVSLLVRRQRETEALVAEQMCQAEERTAATERRYSDLEKRLTGIEEQLTRLIHQFEPSRGDGPVDERLVRLRAQLEELKAEPNGLPLSASGPPVARPALDPAVLRREAEAAPPTPKQAHALSPPGQPVAKPALDPAVLRREADAARPTAKQADRPPDALSTSSSGAASAPVASSTGPAEASPTVATVAPAPADPASRPARGGQPSFLDLLGETPQDRFGLVLMGVGLVAVLYAILSQLHLG